MNSDTLVAMTSYTDFFSHTADFASEQLNELRFSFDEPWTEDERNELGDIAFEAFDYYGPDQDHVEWKDGWDAERLAAEVAKV